MIWQNCLYVDRSVPVILWQNCLWYVGSVPVIWQNYLSLDCVPMIWENCLYLEDGGECQ